MKDSNIYIKCQRSVEVSDRDVFLSDVAEVDCADKLMEAKMKAVKLYRFPQDEDTHVLSTLQIVQKMEAVCQDISVEIVGETDCLVRLATQQSEDRWAQVGKVAFVCLVSFFGTGFTIMAYHNDIGINDVFSGIMRMATGENLPGVSVLELSYSIGLSVGIVVFFNHVGKKRITSDPTPVEVEMYQYKTDVARTIVEMAEREEKT